MTPSQLAVGLLVLISWCLPIVIGARGLARRLLRESPADVRRLGGLVIGLALLTVPAELIGAVGGLHRLPLLATYVAVGAVGWWVGKTTPVVELERRRASWRRPQAHEWLAAGVATLVAGGWFSQTRRAYEVGTLGYDSLSYQLPYAQLMAHSGRTLDVPHVIWFLPNDYFPATGNLVHALGIVATGRDVLSPFVSLLWLGVALLASAVAFREPAAKSAAIAASGTVLLLPGYFTSEAGTALVDLPAAALLLAALSLARREGHVLLVGLAAGMAVGTKLSAAVPAAVLGLTFLVRRPSREVLAYGSGAVIGGGFWFVRNLIRLGSPLPMLNLPGFPRPAHLYDYQVFGTPLGTSLYQPNSIAHYLLRGQHLGTFTGAARDSFGVLWLPLLLGVTGVFVAVARKEPVISGVGLLGLVAYLITPESAPTYAGVPMRFAVVIESKILLPVLLGAGLALAALVARGAQRNLVLALLLALALSAQLDRGTFGLGSVPHWPHPYESWVVAVVAGGLAVLGRQFNVLEIRLGAVAVVALSTGLLVAGLKTWTSHRYEGQDTARDPKVLKMLGSPATLRIAVQGHGLQSYPFWGPKLQDVVTVFGVHGPHGEFRSPQGCAEFLAELARIDPQVLVVTKQLDRTIPPFGPWLVRSGAARLALERDGVQTWVVERDLDANAC